MYKDLHVNIHHPMLPHHNRLRERERENKWEKERKSMKHESCALESSCICYAHVLPTMAGKSLHSFTLQIFLPESAHYTGVNPGNLYREPLTSNNNLPFDHKNLFQPQLNATACLSLSSLAFLLAVAFQDLSEQNAMT